MGRDRRKKEQEKLRRNLSSESPRGEGGSERLSQAGSWISTTDPQSNTTRELQGSATGEDDPGLTATPPGLASSATYSLLDTNQEAHRTVTEEQNLDLNNRPEGIHTQSDTAQEAQRSATGEPGPALTTTPARSASSDLKVSTMNQTEGLSTGQPTPSPSSVSAGERSSATDSALSDPCVNHTVLDQPWRSTNCSHTECTGGQWMSDGKLEVGWYRFNSSGGWKIPETVVPQHRCSGKAPGWLNGPHPNVGEGEMTRTACFTHAQASCHWSLEIRVKNCSGYFVYWLRPTHWSNAVYCTDLGISPREQVKGSSTGGATQEPPSVPSGDTSSGSKSCDSGEDSQSDTTREPQGSVTDQPGLDLTTTPAGSSSLRTDSQLDTTQEPQRSATGESGPGLTTTPPGSVNSDLEVSTMDQPDGSSTGQPTPSPSSVSAGERSSDSQSDTTQEPQGSATEGPGPGLSTTPAGSASSDPDRRTSPDAGQEKPTDATCEASEMVPVNGLLSDEECEEMINSAQVLFIGQNNLGDPREREAYLNQIREILREQLPCKHNLSKSKRDKGRK
ncbi:uncharacterized protein [Hemitrygon akajei]|uniref:uncharacterized protein n=1 Tax=Hemitrygon akajei TaxID=2704970 RepID=UPI003BF9EB72